MSLSLSPTDAPPDDLYDVVRLTLRLSRRFMQALDEPLEQATGLNTKELVVLAAIMDGAHTPGKVAAAQNLPAPTVTRIITTLVGAGLVERVTDPSDLRRFELRLTPQGEATRAGVRASGQAIVGTHFGHVPPATVQAALEALRNLHDALSPQPLAATGRTA
ncbi:DNA-binding MarR family transcriptional regulator [Deinococcus metalli]|uniref:Transcriptional regulator n=1 Tax=Deinococcus metalli TaxID=1141878 RepID=A0A7W8KGY6_9DEIO|nr:MarR family winged helix-turn-helix transcriptional regulator [Deinococcus metalli]MBB5377920.1 DNA-binding MarR family transcriptional regulator [Deinococcus metalli]GHF55103.1 transcriptional regulator [Deinococcus metalli]